ncbi:hypothetical protein GCM10009755_26620 [Brevibacterium samyangense]|uniref:Uncharacterized protein n=1 Tax=Brevibacterium samyangense TaxID=366888 RepID=A0ABP5F0X1_9MICO
MSRAIMRGMRRGLDYHTDDLTNFRKLREEMESSDWMAEAWEEVGRDLSSAMMLATPPTASRFSGDPRSRRSR